jgi:hypothetical protein
MGGMRKVTLKGKRSGYHYEIVGLDTASRYRSATKGWTDPPSGIATTGQFDEVTLGTLAGPYRPPQSQEDWESRFSWYSAYMTFAEWVDERCERNIRLREEEWGRNLGWTPPKQGVK